MRIKEIEDILQIKMEELKNILPKFLQDIFIEEVFIAGGCIYSMYNDQEASDYDFFCKTEEFAKQMHSYFYNMESITIGNEVEEIINSEHRIIVTKNAITIDNFQIVTKWFGSPRSVVEQFDFKHNMFFYGHEYTRLDGGFTDCIHCVSDYKYLTTDKLYFNYERTRDICGTIMRIPKFVARGFKISKYEVASILLKLKENGFDDREDEILKDFGAY